MADCKSAASNIPPFIEAKRGRKLHNLANHPLELVKQKIYAYFRALPGYEFAIFDDLDPVVSVADNFDRLLIPADHPARSRSDTYYVDEKTVLRTHTSAHQNALLAQNHAAFLVTGDVYRKDTIDRHHYPVFHQTEGVAAVPAGTDAADELRTILGGLVAVLFPGARRRENVDYFPFTHSSFEIEVEWGGQWVEILGCGVVQPEILKAHGADDREYWAFGVGLDRLALILYDIPDIRLLWSTHPKFLGQFGPETVIFVPFSRLEPQVKDISFFLPGGDVDAGGRASHDNTSIAKCELGRRSETCPCDVCAGGRNRWTAANEFFDLVREVGGDWVEEVKLVDEYVKFVDEYVRPRRRWSQTYSVVYSAIGTENPAELTAACNDMQARIRAEVVRRLGVDLR